MKSDFKNKTAAQKANLVASFQDEKVAIQNVANKHGVSSNEVVDALELLVDSGQKCIEEHSDMVPAKTPPDWYIKIKSSFNDDFPVPHLVTFLSILIPTILVLFLASGIQYASGDYYELAKRVLNSDYALAANQTTALRPLGYALFLIVTGALSPAFYSATLFVQYVIAIILPLFAYICLRLVFRRNYVTLFCLLLMLSMSPYIYMRSVLSEALYAPTILLMTITVAVFSFKNEDFKYLYFIFALAFIGTLTRPVLLLFPIAFSVIYWLIFRIKFKRLLILNVIFLIGVFVSGRLTAKLVPDHSSGFGIMSFMNVLMSCAYSEEVVSEEDGKYTAELLALIDDNWEEDRVRLMEVIGEKIPKAKKEEVLARYRSQTSSISELLFRHPTLAIYWRIKWLAIKKRGIAKADQLFTQVFKEQFFKRPQDFVRYTGYNLFSFLSGRPKDYRYDIVDEPKVAEVYRKTAYYFGATPNPLERLAGNKVYVDVTPGTMFLLPGFTHSQPLVEFINKYISTLYPIFSLLGLFSFVLLIAFSLKKGLKSSLLTYSSLLFLILCHALVVSIAHPPINRYISPLIFIYFYPITGLLIEIWTFIKEKIDG